MTFEQKIYAIWLKYKPMREAEANAEAVRKATDQELDEINHRRGMAGLPLAQIKVDNPFGFGLPSPTPTWRQEMGLEMIEAAVAYCKDWDRFAVTQ